MLDGKEPLVIEAALLGQRGVVLGHLQIEVGEFVVEHLPRGHIHQFDRVCEVAVIVEGEVEEADGIYALQFIVPRLALLGLFAYGEGGVEDGAVLEELLLSVLHLNENLLALFCLAIHIEDSSALCGSHPQVFGIEVGDVQEVLCPLEARVEEREQQVFVRFGPKEFLEREVRVEVHISGLWVCQ